MPDLALQQHCMSQLSAVLTSHVSMPDIIANTIRATNMLAALR